MPKIRINTIIKTEQELIEQDYDAIMTNNQIKYKDQNGTVSISLFDECIKISRDNLELNFKGKEHTTGQMTLEKNVLSFNIYTNKLIKNDKMIEIDYNIEGQNINYKLNKK